MPGKMVRQIKQITNKLECCGLAGAMGMFVGLKLANLNVI